MSWRAAALVAIMVCASGCGAAYSNKACNIAVNSFAAPYTEATTYIVLPLNQGVAPTDQEFRQYSAYLRKALDAHGYRSTESFEDARLAIFLGYGVGRPEGHLASYIMPPVGRTDVAPGATRSPISSHGSSRTAASRTLRFAESDVSSDPRSSDGETTFTRYAIVNAVDAEEYRTGRRFMRVWSTKIVSVGHTDDLRAMFPVILAGAWDLLGVNAERIVHRQVDLEGAHVVWIKGGPPGLSSRGAPKGEVNQPN
jgi:hypothetical protein